MPKRPRKDAPNQGALKSLADNRRHALFLLCFCIAFIQSGRFAFNMSKYDTFFLDSMVDIPALQFGTRRTETFDQITNSYNNHTTSAVRHSEYGKGAPDRGTHKGMLREPVATAKKKTNLIQDPKTKTWALVSPPGLIGGYRNQVIRMFGLVIATQEQNIQQLLLPSILWSTRINDSVKTRPVPMEDLFDIDHWNSIAETKEELPKLVEAVDMEGEADCWTPPDSNRYNDKSNVPVNEQDFLEDNREFTHTLRTQSADGPLMERILSKPRFLTPIANISLAYTTGHLDINPRKFDVSPDVRHCKNPIAYGAGGGRGQLWGNYMKYNRRRPRDPTTGYVAPSALEQVFLQALRPLPKWRQLAQQCVVEGIQTSAGDNHLRSSGATMSNVLALHPRVELEMMAHSCGTFMNKNLTKIFDDVSNFLRSNSTLAQTISGIFVALHRAGAASKEGRPYHRFRAFVEENIHTMDTVIGTLSQPGEGLSITSDNKNDVRKVPVFECGEPLIARYHHSQISSTGQPAIDYGSLLPSIINFEVATQAVVFVGMRSSSWSNSVWTTRYYQGKGDTNFEYTRERGIQPVENGGLPPPHQNCDGMKDPG